MTDKLDLQSTDITRLNIEKIATLFPNCVTETAEGKKIDFDLLKQELSTEIVEGNKERYRLEWPGKRESIVTANLPTTNTLRPVREDSVDFDTTENIYIEGDNLEVLKLLQESYLNKIKMIYIDPPYNTGKDFVYKDNFAKAGEEELFESGQKDEYNQRLVANPETNGRYHSDWLSMMYPRLKLARNLLTEDGLIYISIDENEVHNLRKTCDEIFGSENLINVITINMNSLSGVKMTHAISGKRYPAQKEYLLIYKRGGISTKLIIEKKNKDIWDKEYNMIIPEMTEGQFNAFEELSENEVNALLSKMRLLSIVDFAKNENIELTDDWKWRNSFRIFGSKSNTSLARKINENIYDQQIVCYTNSDGNKRFFRSDYNKDARDPRIELVQADANSSVFLSDNWIDISNDGGVAQEGEVVFPNGKKPLQLLKRIIKSANFPVGLVLDFFSGSSTTAHAVMQLNSEELKDIKFIMVQLPEVPDEKSEAYKEGYKNICEIGKERIRRAANKIKKEKIEKAKKDGLFADFKDEQDYGFRVYRLDSSNMQEVYYKPQDYNQGTLDLFADNVKEGRTAEDLLTQIMLDWGLPLSLPIERKTISGKEVFAVAGDSLYCCFDNDIDEAFAKEIAQEKPLRIVFRDKGFKDDTAKENVKQLLKQLSGETEMKVI